MFVYLEGNRAKMTLSGNDITIVETKDVVGLMGICGAGTGYTANGSPNVGNLSLYGKLTTDGQAHCPYNYNLGADWDTAGSWDEFTMRAIEEEAYLLGFGHGDAGGAEPIVVNGKERTPISLIASAVWKTNSNSSGVKSSTSRRCRWVQVVALGAVAGSFNMLFTR